MYALSNLGKSILVPVPVQACVCKPYCITLDYIGSAEYVIFVSIHVYPRTGSAWHNNIIIWECLIKMFD